MNFRNNELPDNKDCEVRGQGEPGKEKHEKEIDQAIRRDEIEIATLEEVLEEKKEELYHLEKEHDHPRQPQEIIVNTKKKEYPEKEISFRKVVLLGYPDAIFDERYTYTVEYKKGPEQNPKGSLTDDNSVYVKDKMEFDVERGDKS
ncbi:MAG TPA: multiubiquitin domain-containing protein [Mucilaginibacter sp.]|jgi:hypothetical protein|nr:multiubiquitin domain-containing protein [Mucilaginibacter sp.]